MTTGETDDPKAEFENYVAEADITKGDPVYLSSDDKVSPATSAQECIGIAVMNSKADRKAAILVKGRVKVKAGAAIARGKAVQGSDASKRILALADQTIDESGAASYTVFHNRKLGTALESAVDANDLIFIKVDR